MIIRSDITPHKGQRQMLDCVLRNPVRNNIINATRQFGKSVLGRELINWFAFNYKEYEQLVLKPKFQTQKCKILWLSPTIAQARKVYKEMEKAWTPVLQYKNKTERLLVANNGTQVQFFGVENPDNIRGEDVNYMICDEFAHYKKDVYNAVLRPMLVAQGKMVFFISTPKGLNDFYEMKERGISKDFPRYKYVKGMYTENPFYDIEEIEDAKNTIPDALFRQEYMGEFVGGGATVFGDYESLAILNSWTAPEPTMQYYNGNDIAKQKDWTVSTTIDQNHRVVDMLRMRRLDWQLIIDSLITNLNKYKPYSLLEVNGVGDPVFDLVRLKYSQIQPFVTTNQSKQQIIQGLILSCNEKTIKLPSIELCPSLHEQMNVFTFDYSPEKRQIVYHAHEGFHDDDVISLALANFQFRRMNRR